MAIGLTLVVSLAFSGATGPDTGHSSAIHAKPSVKARRNELSVSVNRRGSERVLSPELMHDLSVKGKTRDELTTHPAFAIAPQALPASRPTSAPATRAAPFLPGLYTGAARIVAQSNGKSRIAWMEVTGYCPCAKCCGPDAAGITASGKPVSYNGGAFAAADADELPFGAVLRIPGYHDGARIEVIDRGSAIRHAKVDVFFPTHEQAEIWGRQWVAVIVEK